ncbi:GNAT family N-acetyltransferase [Nocardia sp. NPDC003999]
MAAAERTPGTKWAYICALDGDDLVAGMPLSYRKYEPTRAFTPEHLAGGLGVDPGRWALAGARMAARNSVAVVAAAEAGAVRRRLLAEANSVARQWGLDGVVLPYVPAEHVGAWAELEPYSSAVAADEAVISLPCGDEEDYLAMLTVNRARSVRREQREFDAAGYRITRVPADPASASALAPMLAEVERKYGGNGSLGGLTKVVAHSLAACANSGHVLLSHDPAGNLSMCALMYRFGDSLYARFVGRRPDSESGPFEYFNVLFYEPIRWALKEGIDRYFLGQGSIAAKSSRGASRQELSHLLWRCGQDE